MQQQGMRQNFTPQEVQRMSADEVLVLAQRMNIPDPDLMPVDDLQMKVIAELAAAGRMAAAVPTALPEAPASVPEAPPVPAPEPTVIHQPHRVRPRGVLGMTLVEIAQKVGPGISLEVTDETQAFLNGTEIPRSEWQNTRANLPTDVVQFRRAAGSRG